MDAIKGTFHARMGTIKERNGKALTEAGKIKEEQQEYTEELYIKGLNDPDNYEGVVTHLEPDILECEVKWALGSITTSKASRGDGIPAERLKVLKVMLLQCCIQYVSKFGKPSSGHKIGKGQFSFQSQRRIVPKNDQTIVQLCSFHMLVRSCSKYFQAGLQQYVKQECPEVQTEFQRGRGTRDQIAYICWIIEKARNFTKASTSASLPMQKPLTLWITATVETP